jgi:hypothetical protein
MAALFRRHVAEHLLDVAATTGVGWLVAGITGYSLAHDEFS